MLLKSNSSLKIIEKLYSFVHSVAATIKRKKTVLHTRKVQHKIKPRPDPKEIRCVVPVHLDPHDASISAQHNESECCVIKEINEQQQQQQQQQTPSLAIETSSQILATTAAEQKTVQFPELRKTHLVLPLAAVYSSRSQHLASDEY